MRMVLYRSLHDLVQVLMRMSCGDPSEILASRHNFGPCDKEVPGAAVSNMFDMICYCFRSCCFSYLCIAGTIFFYLTKRFTQGSYELFSFGRSVDMFKTYMSGRFGENVLDLYLAKLKSFPDLEMPQMAKHCFIAGIVTMGDCWRRFCFERDRL